MVKLMTHIVAGYPTMGECERIARAMIEAGVAFLEIQIPFSDPVADGPVIQEANRIALERNTNPKDCFELIKKLRAYTNIPLLFMTYANIPFAYGLERFCRDAKRAGADGLILPDLPFDTSEGKEILKFFKKYGLKAIPVIAPVTQEKRLRTLAQCGHGLVYAMSHCGITGERKKANDLGAYLKKIKKYFKGPVAVGFGIRSAKQAHKLSQYADVVVIGSRLIELYQKQGLSGVKRFLQPMTMSPRKAAPTGSINS